jgi:hypothetical protein
MHRMPNETDIRNSFRSLPVENQIRLLEAAYLPRLSIDLFQEIILTIFNNHKSNKKVMMRLGSVLFVFAFANRAVKMRWCEPIVRWMLDQKATDIRSRGIRLLGICQSFSLDDLSLVESRLYGNLSDQIDSLMCLFLWFSSRKPSPIIKRIARSKRTTLRIAAIAMRSRVRDAQYWAIQLLSTDAFRNRLTRLVTSQKPGGVTATLRILENRFEVSRPEAIFIKTCLTSRQWRIRLTAVRCVFALKNRPPAVRERFCRMLFEISADDPLRTAVRGKRAEPFRSGIEEFVNRR